MKNTERNRFAPFMALVNMYATKNAATLMMMVVTIVNSTVSHSACRNSGSLNTPA